MCDHQFRIDTILHERHHSILGRNFFYRSSKFNLSLLHSFDTPQSFELTVMVEISDSVGDWTRCYGFTTSISVSLYTNFYIIFFPFIFQFQIQNPLIFFILPIQRKTFFDGCIFFGVYIVQRLMQIKFPLCILIFL